MKVPYKIVRRRAFDDNGYQQTRDKNPRFLEAVVGRKDPARFCKPCESFIGPREFRRLDQATAVAGRLAETQNFGEYYTYTVQPAW